VDDNPINRDILAQYLSSWGIATAAADDGDRALAMLGAASRSGQPYDLVILDHKMPRMDGISCLKEMRATAALESVRVILLSSMDLALRNPDIETLKIDESLTKPVRQARLHAALMRVMGHDITLQTMQMRAQPYAAEHLTKLGNIRVLLVEDNDVNREVALGMLAALGCECRVAVNGAQAVEMFMHGGFDAILMDCHMPVMDGYSAATAMRAAEVQHNRGRMPVLAITANAMDGGRERCIAAGMDDFLVKPFTMAQLRALLERWAKKPIGGTPIVPTSDHDDTREATLDTRAIAAIQALRSPDLVNRIITLYESRAPALISTGHAAVIGNDANALATAAHELKSSSANLGGERLARACKECEVAARKQDLAGAKALWIEVCNEFDRFSVALHGVRSAATARESVS
jgi:CheY-like chemotaxis protein/HPt (histidine-containing phosphotransfer) domain-containing protein